MRHPFTSSLYTHCTASILTVLLGFSVPAWASQNTPPTALDMMELLMQEDLGRGVDYQRLLETGVLANMRIPAEHLKVAFIDTRNGEPVSRDERRHILGQSRQEGAHEILRLAASRFDLPGGFDLDVMLDLFDAAALSSMRQPPQHVSIEFYDQRRGPEGSQRGGISGEIPDYVFSPEEGLQAQERKSEEVTSPSRTQVLGEWPDSRITEYFLNRGYRFTGQSNQAVSPIRSFAASEQDFHRRIIEETSELEELASEHFGHPVTVDDISFERIAEVAIPGLDKNLYISLIRITGSRELIQVTRVACPLVCHNQNEKSVT